MRTALQLQQYLRRAAGREAMASNFAAPCRGVLQQALNGVQMHKGGSADEKFCSKSFRGTATLRRPSKIPARKNSHPVARKQHLRAACVLDVASVPHAAISALHVGRAG
jgi:hypothetical protein